MKKGAVYSIMFSVLIVFLTIGASIYFSNYRTNQNLLKEFIIHKKLLDNFKILKYNYERAVGINNKANSTYSFTFPLNDDKSFKNKTLSNYQTFINTIYKNDSRINITITTNTLINNIINETDYYNDTVYGINITKEYSNNRVLFSKTDNMTGVTITIAQSGSINNQTWIGGNPNPGDFNFTIITNYNNESYAIARNNKEYTINFAGGGNVTFQLDLGNPNRMIIIDNLNYTVIPNVNITVKICTNKTTNFQPKTKSTLLLNDYQNKISINGLI